MLKNKTELTTSLPAVPPSTPSPKQKPTGARPHAEIKSNVHAPIPVDISVSTSSHM